MMKLQPHVVRVSVAINAQAITMVGQRGAATRVVTAPFTYDEAAPAPALAAALQHARAALETQLGATTVAAHLHVALLPPLAEARLLSLPPLRKAEAEAVVRRDAGRYFVGIATPRIVAVHMPPRGVSNAPVIAVAAAATLVEAVRTAVAEAGWRGGVSVAAAQGCWMAAARQGAPEVLIAVDSGTAHVLRLGRGIALGARRAPAHDIADIMQAVADLGAGVRARAVVFADGAQRDVLARELAAAGMHPIGLTATAAEAAARHAHEAPLRLTPLTVLAERRDQEKRLAQRLVIAAVMLLLASAAVELWGARRQLNTVRARRAEIRADVAPLLLLRDSADQLSQRTVELETLVRTTPRWTGALFDIALLLPPEAYVTRLHATGDTLIIDAEGERAGIALQALRSAGTLRNARLLGSIERELADGSTTMERFRLMARLAGARPAAVARADTAVLDTGAR